MTTVPIGRCVLLVPVALLLGCGPDSDEIVFEPQSFSEPSFSKLNFSPWSDPVSLGPLISTSSSNEQDAALSKDGLSLYFVSDRTGGIGGNDIWVSQRSDRDAQWGPPVNLGSPINTSSNENTVALSRDGHWLFFGSGRPGGFGASELYASYRDHVHDDFAWQAPANLGAGVNTADVELSPSYFENDEGGLPQLYFTRGRFPVPGGDIYVSELTADGSWGVAVPVAGVNSSAAERGPSVSHDGLNLYFWSNRSGAVHIFVSTRESVFDPWSAAQRVDVSLGESGEVEPFIHYHAGIETLLMVGDIVGGNNDLFMSMRTRRGGAR